jgi:hypothetical protein
MIRFRNLIDAMPVTQQAFTTKFDTWSNYVNEAQSIERLFNGRDTIELSRGNLFDVARTGDLEKLLVSVIMWGYPRGMRGRHFQDILDCREHLFQVLTDLQENPEIENWSQHYNAIVQVRGMGMSTYTKLLYFMGARVGAANCLIFDDRIVRTINKRLFLEFRDIDNVSTATMSARYPEYLRIMSAQANVLGLTSEKIELFLFQFGLNVKVDGY